MNPVDDPLSLHQKNLRRLPAETIQNYRYSTLVPFNGLKLIPRSFSPQLFRLIRLLLGVPGIGTLTAMKLLTELENINRFPDFDRLRSYVGLVPSTASSGENLTDTGITPRTNSRLRVALIESAWVAIRNDPALLLAYQDLRKRMPGNRAIVRIAKKLLNRIAFVLRTQNKYEKGVVK